MKPITALLIICLPLKTLKVTSPYGLRIHPVNRHLEYHPGVDLRARYDTVYAVLNGVVRSVRYDQSLGSAITLQHADLVSIYGHLSKYLVVTGDSVHAGQPIAISGASGRVTAAHLHFSMRYRHHYLNPLDFLYQLLKLTDHEQKLQTTARTDR